MNGINNFSMKKQRAVHVFSVFFVSSDTKPANPSSYYYTVNGQRGTRILLTVEQQLKGA
jgi:hypothetical protein